MIAEKNSDLTKVTRFLKKEDGTEVKIIAEIMVGRGLHESVGVYALHRKTNQEQWQLLSDRPSPNWREMSVSAYTSLGRSPLLQVVGQAEILKTAAMLRH